MIYYISDENDIKVSNVGGKAKALMETFKAGFPVPHCLVLSVEFFKSWINKIKQSDEWSNVINSPTLNNCNIVKEKVKDFKFTPNMRNEFIRKIDIFGDNTLFAVRSSSPEEDLDEVSFAGMYETFLGIKKEDIESYIIKVFASCLDYRVIAYKINKGIEIDKIRIAIIIQEQISSDISGVGFSINPLNNAYDEVMINASFGLGEAIVSGKVTPDTYIYDIVEEKIITKQVNNKEIGIYLKEDGGLVERENENKNRSVLSDNDILKIVKMIKRCEKYYGKPIDIEWAICDNVLYLLQARPITTYFPFFEELLTKPKEEKKFYIDLMLMTQGFQESFSVLGLDIWANMLQEIKVDMLTKDIKGTAPAIHGRQYLNVAALKKVFGYGVVKKLIDSYDMNIKKIFEGIDLKSNKQNERPEGTKYARKKAIKMVFGMLPFLIKSIFFNYQDVVDEYNEQADDIINSTRKLKKADDFKYNALQVGKLLNRIMRLACIIYAGMLAKSSINKIFKGEDIKSEITLLSMNLRGNPTSEMGYLLYKLASHQEFIDTLTCQEFKDNIKNRSYSKEFMKAYDEFMFKYSCRGIKEIDVASVRIYEDIGLLYDKLVKINIDDNQILDVKEKRNKAYEKLRLLAKKKGKEKKFIKVASIYQATFGYREHPKYMMVYIIGKLHMICLDIAKDWVNEGRLEEMYQIFDLSIDEISKAQKDKSFDIMKAREKNLEGYNKMKNVINWPLVIDSRGKIYKARLSEEEGKLIGDFIAPGKVTGKAKVLKSPYEKPVYPGEIIIAKATEPSWTPIFINAAGVIMEIGGPLQHGGIIAREYGIPCVSGLMGIMDIIKDGDLVEVDGDNATVKIINDNN